MHTKYLKIILLLFFPSFLIAQDVKPLKSSDYLKSLENSRDSLYKQIIREFETYISAHPDDIDVRIEHCKVIATAYYDSYDDYNPLEEEHSICLNTLISDFPENSQVLLYHLDQCWGDSAIRVANKIIALNRSKPGSWTNHDLSIVYENLANSYNYNGTPDQVIVNAELAQSLNDTIDLTYLLAQQYEEKNLYDKAIALLESKIDTSKNLYMTYRKAILLLELGAEKRALELFQLIQKDTTLYIDNGKIAQAFVKNGLYAEAREYLLRDLSKSYNKSVVLHELFEYDYEHSPKDTVLATYGRLMEQGLHNDTFGKYRLMMMFKAPFGGWQWNDTLKFLYFLLLLLIIFIAPYIYVLPIDFVSNRFGLRNETPALEASTWSLTDFWIVSSLIILIDILVYILFSYPSLLAAYFNDMYVEEDNKISLNQANQAIVFFFLLLVMTIGYLKKTDYQFLKSTKWKVGKSIGLGLLFAFLFRTIYFTLVKNGVLPAVEVSMMSTILDYFKSINQYYHPLLTFAFAVIIVPFYEEYIFRGIALNSLDRRIKFWAANIIQSVLFALVHENTSLFLFYFFTGIILGLMVKKSNSLVPALSFHATNNFIAFLAIMRM